MMIFVYVLLFSILFFLGHRLKQMWHWFNEINHDTWLLHNTQTPERVYRFLLSIPKQLSSLESVRLILNGKLFKMYEEMSSPEMTEQLDAVIVGLEKYNEEVFEITVLECFYQWIKLTNTSYGHFYLCLFRYLYFFEYYELRHLVDVTPLRVDLRDRISRELRAYLEKAGPLTPKVLVDDECRIFFNQLLTKYDESQHGKREVIESVIVGQLLNVVKMSSLLGESFREHYNKEVLEPWISNQNISQH